MFIKIRPTFIRFWASKRHIKSNSCQYIWWAYIWGAFIERFHSSGQRLCKFIGKKKAFTWEKISTPRCFFLVQQHSGRFIVLEHQNGRHDVMWKRSIISLSNKHWKVSIGALPGRPSSKKENGLVFNSFLSISFMCYFGVTQGLTIRKNGPARRSRPKVYCTFNKSYQTMSLFNFRRVCIEVIGSWRKLSKSVFLSGLHVHKLKRSK